MSISSIVDFADIDAVMFDCDGVIWVGNSLVPGADRTLQKLREQGKKVVFVTNNSTKSREQYLEKCQHLGIEARLEEFFTSSFAAAAYLQSLNFTQKVFIIGEVGIAHELDQVGIRHVDSWQVLGTKAMTREELDVMQIDPEIGAVIVGSDVQFTFAKLAYGLRALNARTDCILLATNTDHSMPLPGGPLPGAGAVVAAISTASQRQPLVAGKPEQLLMDIAVQRCGLNRARTLMVGDKLDTDILFGQRGGMRTALVLSGVTSASEISGSDIRPDFVLHSIAELL